jgi:hypothetical protein
MHGQHGRRTAAAASGRARHLAHATATPAGGDADNPNRSGRLTRCGGSTYDARRWGWCTAVYAGAETFLLAQKSFGFGGGYLRFAQVAPSFPPPTSSGGIVNPRPGFFHISKGHMALTPLPLPAHTRSRVPRGAPGSYA